MTSVSGCGSVSLITNRSTFLGSGVQQRAVVLKPWSSSPLQSRPMVVEAKTKTSTEDRTPRHSRIRKKSSFLGRLTKSSISEGSRKRGLNVVRGYIFERDDSNSKSSNSVPEEPSAPETIIQEKSRPKRAPTKFTASQLVCFLAGALFGLLLSS